MTQSMTAYAQAAVNTDLGELSCELRSVNHRYLEIAPRMPEELRVHESALRDAISEKLSRGRVDCFIRLKENEASSLEPNSEAVINFQALLEGIQAHVPGMQAVRAIDVLRWPGILQAKQTDPQVMKSHLLDILDQALDGMIEARANEGNKIADLIQQRLEGMQQVIKGVEDEEEDDEDEGEDEEEEEDEEDE